MIILSLTMIKENYDITALTTFGVPAKARYFAEYSSVKELQLIMRTPEYQRSEVLHIGGGSNLLFLRDFDGMIIRSAIKGLNVYRKNDDTVYLIAGAGEDWPSLVDFCVDNGLAGLENLAGIPGQAGASAVQNIGAYGVEAKDTIFRVECYDRLTHTIRNFTNEECGFGYRDSIFKHEAKGRYFVLRVCYRLKPSERAEHLDYGPLRELEKRLGHEPDIKEVRDEIVKVRGAKLPDPKELGSAGSFFKNPVVSRPYFENYVLARHPDAPSYDIDENHVKIPAGWLIEHAGLKGVHIGGAKVYEKQCLVIVNTGNATGMSVKALADHIVKTVKEKFDVMLHPEVNYIDTSIHVEVLGSGTSKGVPEPACLCEVCRSDDPHDKRLRASVLVKTHGMTLLIDASPDFRYQALRTGLLDIDATLLTHQHYDHVGGLDDLRAYGVDRNMPVYALPSVASDLRKRLDYCFRPHPYPGVPNIELHEIGESPFYFNGLKIVSIRVMHAKLPILGYRIGNFAYITDAKSVEDSEIEKLQGVKVLIVNALRYRPHFSHFDVDEALEFIAKVKPQTAYLTHICHEMGKHAEVEKRLPENVHLAYDGLKFLVL